MNMVLFDKFQISDSDITASIMYYGYQNKDDGSHVIMLSIKTGNVTEYRYAMSMNGDYTTNWGNRSTLLTYFYYDVCWDDANLIENV